MALTDNLISYWKLDEASGNAIDAHGSNDLTDTNTVGSGTGKINNARDFEASNSEYFTIADNADLSTGDIDFTLQAWINLESNGTYTILGRWTSSYEYILYYDTGDNRLKLAFSQDGYSVNFVVANNFGALSTSTWYCVHSWHDSVNNLVGISVNGGTADTVAHTTGIYNSNSNFTIGRNDDGGGSLYFDGLIDEVGFWKRVLTSDERTELYNSGNGLAYPFSSNVTVTPTTLALVLATYAPTVSTPVVCTPTTVALTLTTFAPTVSTPVVCTPATLAIVTTGYEPSVNIGYTITPDTLALTLTTYAPTVSTPVTCTPTTAALTITTYAPVIDDGSGPYSNIISIVSRFP